ncbi:MAG: DUF2793 domain-containing protein, partial [Pseudomonadota bacterium]|nr:DUF2793 domain-containing protein [Pseudomonadota bacterium]
ALALIDLLLGGSLEAAPIAALPASPVAGGLYLVAASGASGLFAGMEGRLAGWTEGGWRFVAPIEGLRLTVRSSGVELHYWDDEWHSGSVRAEELVIGGARVVGAAAPAIAGPAGGGTIDTEARACVGQILEAMRGHGLI